MNDDLRAFRVNPAAQNLNATYIAQTLGDAEFRVGLRDNNQLTIVRAGVGRFALEAGEDLSMPQMQFQQIAVVEPEAEPVAVADSRQEPAIDPTIVYLITDPPCVPILRVRGEIGQRTWVFCCITV